MDEIHCSQDAKDGKGVSHKMYFPNTDYFSTWLQDTFEESVSFYIKNDKKWIVRKFAF